VKNLWKDKRFKKPPGEGGEGVTSNFTYPKDQNAPGGGKLAEGSKFVRRGKRMTRGDMGKFRRKYEPLLLKRQKQKVGQKKWGGGKKSETVRGVGGGEEGTSNKHWGCWRWKRKIGKVPSKRNP